MKIKFKKIHPDAKLPKQGKAGDAAFDVCCVEDFDLTPGATKAVSTGLVLADMPANDQSDGSGLFLQVEGRSGLALKGIFPIGGIIDATYRGEIKVILHNGNQHTWVGKDKMPTPSGELVPVGLMAFPKNLVVSFKAGDRVAQLVIRKIVANDGYNTVDFELSDEVTETQRGADGFGSTDDKYKHH